MPMRKHGRLTSCSPVGVDVDVVGIHGRIGGERIDVRRVGRGEGILAARGAEEEWQQGSRRDVANHRGNVRGRADVAGDTWVITGQRRQSCRLAHCNSRSQRGDRFAVMPTPDRGGQAAADYRQEAVDLKRKL